MTFVIGAKFEDALANEAKWLAVEWAMELGLAPVGSVPDDFSNVQAKAFLDARVDEFLKAKYRSLNNNKWVGTAVEAAHDSADAEQAAVFSLISPDSG